MSLVKEDGITEDVYHNLFVSIGLDESLQQNFFKHRCELLQAGDALAYDSSTISTYSANQNEARYATWFLLAETISVFLSELELFVRFGRVGTGISEPFGILEISFVLSTLLYFFSG